MHIIMISFYGPCRLGEARRHRCSKPGRKRRVVVMNAKFSWSIGVAVAVVTTLIAAGCGSAQPKPTTSTFPGTATPTGTWAYPNGDLDNTRDATGSEISAANVSGLKEAWTLKLAGTAATGVSGIG